MGDYKRVAAGMYDGPNGIKITKSDRGEWDIYLPAVRRGVRLVGFRDTLREAKTAADILLRNMIDAAHAEALTENALRAQGLSASGVQVLDWLAGHGVQMRDLTPAAVTQAIDADHGEANQENFRRRKVTYDALQADLSVAAAAHAGRPLRIEAAADVIETLTHPFHGRHLGSRVTFLGHDITPAFAAPPGTWRMLDAVTLEVLGHSPIDARAILRRVLAEIDAQEVGKAGSVNYGMAVLAVKRVAEDLGVEL